MTIYEKRFYEQQIPDLIKSIKSLNLTLLEISESLKGKADSNSFVTYSYQPNVDKKAKKKAN